MQDINLSKFIGLPSSKDEKKYLEANPCDCSNNPWVMQEKTEVLQQDGREYFIRKAFCNICGSSKEFFFHALIEDPSTEDKDDNPRFVHYFIAHRVLPENFFDDPVGFVYVLKEPNANNRLRSLWEHLNAEAKNDGGETILPDGLQSEKIRIKNWEGVIISMPEPRFTAEAAFVACLLSEDATQHRYFVYEYTFPDNKNENKKLGILCEWLPGQRRRNFERRGPVTKEACVRLIAEQLDSEETRTQAGARSINSATWDMIEEKDFSNVYLENEAYRHHICLFAYYIAPSIFCDQELDFSNFNGMQEVLQDAWAELGEICEQNGYSYISPEAISFKMYEYNAEEIFFLTFPAPLSLPEPYFLAVKPTARQTIYFCEKSSAVQNGALFTKIERGSHSIQGEIEQPDEVTFLDAIYGKFKKDPEINILQHLASYAMINATFKALFQKEP